MKATNSLLSAPLLLKLVGCILILSSLLDYSVLLIPLNYQDKAWLVGTLTQLVDRGVLPLLGIALLFTGYWLEGGGEARTSPFVSLRFWALILSTVLGVIFLVTMPLALVNYNRASEDQVKEIDKQATEAQAKLESQVQQSQDQLNSLLSNKPALDQQLKQLDEQLKQIDEAIAQGRVKPEQLPEVQKRKKEMEEIKADPTKLGNKVKEARDQTLTKIREEQSNKTNQIKQGALKTGIRVGLSSLMLAIGYTTIGWLGLRNLGSLSGDRKA
jgi:ABC-type multidrug transport system fused ATPase/permease subunit